MKNKNAVKRFIRVSEVLSRVGFSRTTLYERIKEGSFPDRVKIGLRLVAFVESEIDAWIVNTIAQSRNVSK
ncbi:helix-turn-helix transcriptional regulator [Pectobacterium brasiliense]|uniref:helix-turn-helix transcriptional regulator n=1 Tax=Pectobacterium brasiliense TaxID=180957 RepID=UPI0032EFE918